MTLTSGLFPVKLLYNVVFDGELIVEASRDPECDLARALKARGYTGKVTMVDGATGKPRTIINIEKASRLTVKEGPLRFEAIQSTPEAPYSLEEASVGV